MEKVYKIFISSTYKDLKGERMAIIKSILRMHYLPVCMELFGASSYKQWDIIRNAIDISDCYVLIIKCRYGSIEPSSGKSYTESEFDYAVSKGIPVLAFIYNEKSSGKELKIDHPRKLEKFKSKVMMDRTVAWWSNETELISQLVPSLYNEFRCKENEDVNLSSLDNMILSQNTCIISIMFNVYIIKYMETVESLIKKTALSIKIKSARN